MEPGRRYRALVIALERDRALLELDNDEKIWMPAAPRTRVVTECMIQRGPK